MTDLSQPPASWPEGRVGRRHWLKTASLGFGALAFDALASGTLESGTLASRGLARGALAAEPVQSGMHHPARAKHVIFCYMSGGVSHVDSFDPKPRLAQDAGKPMPMKIERTQFNNNGLVMPSPFEFQQYGESGIPVSSMFPLIGREADELAVVRSMTTPVNEHAQGNFFAHTGFPVLGYPSAGAWVAYGLGSENENLPGYVVLQAGGASVPHGGVGLFSNGFLPAHHQGSILHADRREAVANLLPSEPLSMQRRRLALTRDFDQQFLGKTGASAAVEAAIKNAETAARMQTAVPELCDLSEETQATRAMYGLDDPDRELAGYARQCLLARRLVERGVRFIELSCLTKGIGAGNGPNPWDQHADLASGHGAMARQVDQPIAALIRDLRQRGLLDETLIVWTGEFGRTPFSQGSAGRDHNPFGFSIWMAGGGVRGGTIYGATDEYGYHAIENKTTLYDLWATVLHQLGIDHERLTYRYSGRDFRLTDVHGNVLHPILRG
jgi:hypothetical protein